MNNCNLKVKEMIQGSKTNAYLPILWLLAALGIFSTSMSLPSLPAMGKALNASDNAVQLSLSLLFLGSALGNLLLGPVSDKKGRLYVAKGGLIIFIIASLGCALSESIVSLIISRFFQGFGASCGMLVARAVGRDLFEGAELTRYSSTIMMVISVSPAVAPTMGGFIEAYLGWQMNFYFLMLFGLVVAVFVWRILPETKETPPINIHFSKTFKNYLSLFKDPMFSLPCFILGTQMTATFLYITLSPYLYMKVFGWSPQFYGFLGILGAFANIVGFAVSKRLAYILSFRSGMIIGSLLSLFISLVYIGISWTFPPSAVYLVAFIALYFAFSALSTVNASTAAMNINPEKAGIAAAMIGAIQIGSGFLGGLLSSLLPTSLFIMGVAIGVLCFLSVLASYRLWLGR